MRAALTPALLRRTRRQPERAVAVEEVIPWALLRRPRQRGAVLVRLLVLLVLLVLMMLRLPKRRRCHRLLLLLLLLLLAPPLSARSTRSGR